MMTSARQRGTAKACIDKFNDAAKANQQDLANGEWQRPGSSVTATHLPVYSGSTMKERLNNLIESTSNKIGKGATTYELSCVGRQSGARSTIEKFNKVAEMNQEKLDRNPYSETYTIQHFDTRAADYGRPPKGSKTEARGIKAGVHVMREILFLMETINEYATGDPPDRVISFGELFHIYEHYSNKLVGMLLRARKYGLVDFTGEMLYQRQDDDKPIRMLKSIIEIRELVQSSNDPVNCIALTQ